jgi:hypothetical protein
MRRTGKLLESLTLFFAPAAVPVRKWRDGVVSQRKLAYHRRRKQ